MALYNSPDMKSCDNALFISGYITLVRHEDTLSTLLKLITCTVFYLQTYLEQTKMKFSRNYQGMNLNKITTTVGLNSKF